MTLPLRSSAERGLLPRPARAYATQRRGNGQIGVLALIYLQFAIVSRAGVGVVGFVGALFVLASLFVHGRSNRLAVVLLVVGAIPFAVVAWWTVVIPLTCLVMLGIGIPFLMPGSSERGAALP